MIRLIWMRANFNNFVTCKHVTFSLYFQFRIQQINIMWKTYYDKIENFFRLFTKRKKISVG